MKPIHLSLMLLAGLGLAAPAWSQSATPSQERRADCQKQASDKGLRSGPERREFMRECVHGKPTAAKPATPATPAEPAKPAAAKDPAKSLSPMGDMVDCKKQADEKSLRGADRRTFMRECMHPKKK